MVIRPGQEWGRREIPPEGLHSAHDDRAIAELFSSGVRDVAVLGGDMFRTLGGSSARGRSASAEMTRLPIDILRIRYQSLGNNEWSVVHAIAHVVLRSANSGGGWLNGPAVIVANAQYLGRWDVAPRGHPNDGRCEVLEVNSKMPIRQRLLARRRLFTGTHLPHPLITSSSTKQYRYHGSGLVLWVDGSRTSAVEQVEIEVVVDGIVLWV